MPNDNEKHDDAGQQKRTSLNIRELYEYVPEDLILNVSSTHYSNVTYMQVAPREVVLDFLELPGIKKDGKMVIEGTRIYMSHVAAQTLVERLGKLLEKAYNDGGIAKPKFDKSEDIELTSEINRPTEDEET